jgi:hypothetical protein
MLLPGEAFALTTGVRVVDHALGGCAWPQQ